jgi:hypothetical protein
MDNVRVKRFLEVTSNLIAHTKQVKKLKGENFNLFKILRAETAETTTHSNFIAELLNPHGSHDLGSKPLQYFLQTLQIDVDQDLSYVKVFTEYHIGNIDTKNATGGRIDILLKFPNGTTYCIENKIHADDQYQQIQRYCNYNKPNNKVFYLTLTGNIPKKKSKKDLVPDSDFFIISYQDHILNWLLHCLKDATNHPILRESIKQYIILIKKLTNTLDKTEQIKLRTLIFDYLEEAEYIASNLSRAVLDTKNCFREVLMKRLAENLDSSKFVVSYDSKVEKKYSQIWIDLKGYEKPQLRFGIEPFSGDGHHDGQLYVGILDLEGINSSFHLNNEDNFTEWWVEAKYLKYPQENLIQLNDPAFLKRIHNPNSTEFLEVTNSIVKQITDFVSNYEVEVEGFLKSKHPKNATV